MAIVGWHAGGHIKLALRLCSASIYEAKKRQYITLSELGGQSIKLGSEIDFKKLTQKADDGMMKLFDLDLEIEAVTIPVPATTQQVINIVKILGVKERSFEEKQT